MALQHRLVVGVLMFSCHLCCTSPDQKSSGSPGWFLPFSVSLGLNVIVFEFLFNLHIAGQSPVAATQFFLCIFHFQCHASQVDCWFFTPQQKLHYCSSGLGWLFVFILLWCSPCNTPWPTSCCCIGWLFVFYFFPSPKTAVAAQDDFKFSKVHWYCFWISSSSCTLPGSCCSVFSLYISFLMPCLTSWLVVFLPYNKSSAHHCRWPLQPRLIIWFLL